MEYFENLLRNEPYRHMTFPFKELPKDREGYDFVDIVNNIKNNLSSKVYVEPQSFEFLVTETMNNIYDHSKFEKAYILSKQYPNLNVTDICLIDNGISIPGNFEKASFKFNNDAEAILGAINGTSTDIYDTGFSGRGLNTITQLTTLGFKEEILIASRKGLCYVTQKGSKLYNIDEKYVKGTFVAIRINETMSNKDFYKFTAKLRKIEKI